MKKTALLALCLVACAPRAIPAASLLDSDAASPCDAGPQSPPSQSALCLRDEAGTSRAVFSRYDVFGSVSRTDQGENPEKYHRGLFDFEFIKERGGTGALGRKTQSHVLSAVLVKNTLGEAHGIMNARTFAPGVGDVIGQFMNVFGGGSWVSSDEGLIAYRTFVADVARIPVAAAAYRAGDPYLTPEGLAHGGWRNIGEGNLVVFTEEAVRVQITGYRSGRWSYSRPADRNFSGSCFALDATAFTAPDDEGKSVTVYHWLPVDDDGNGTFSTGQMGADTGRDVHMPRQYPRHVGPGRMAPCERVAFVDRAGNRIGIVSILNEDWSAGDDDWNDPGRHPSRNGCSGRCLFQVVPLANAQVLGYKAIVSHKLGSPNPDAIDAFSAVCTKSSYDCDTAFDLRSKGESLDGSRTRWTHGLHSRRGSVEVLAAMETSGVGREAFGEIDVARGGADRVEVFRIRRRGQLQPDLGLWADLDEASWRVGDKRLLVGGSLEDGGACTWNRSAGAIDCSRRRAAAPPDGTPIAARGETPQRYASNDERVIASALARASERARTAAEADAECHHRTLFAPSEVEDHFLAKRPYGFELTGIECIAEGGGAVEIALEACAGDGSGCTRRSDPVSCDADGGSDDGATDARVDAGQWLRVALGSRDGAVAALTYSICGSRQPAS